MSQKWAGEAVELALRGGGKGRQSGGEAAEGGQWEVHTGLRKGACSKTGGNGEVPAPTAPCSGVSSTTHEHPNMTWKQTCH